MISTEWFEGERSDNKHLNANSVMISVHMIHVSVAGFPNTKKPDINC